MTIQNKEATSADNPWGVYFAINADYRRLSGNSIADLAGEQLPRILPAAKEIQPGSQ